MCDRHWDRPAAGLFKVRGSMFGISSWMCAQCVPQRANPAEVRRRASAAARSARKAASRG